MPDIKNWPEKFRIGKSLRYHAYRRAFWAYADAMTKSVAAVSGTATFVSVLGSKSGITFWAALTVTVFSTLDLVLNFDARSRLYDGLYKKFSDLEADLSSVELEDDQAGLVSIRRGIIIIEREEPTSMTLLEMRCWGEEARANGRDVPAVQRLAWFEVLLSQVWPFAPFWRADRQATLPPKSETTVHSH